MSALQTYLSQTRSTLACALSSPDQPVTVVMGNEACDMDSAVSALALAFGLDGGPAAPAVPLLNIPRREFPLRQDLVMAVTDWLGVSPDLLPFRDDVNFVSEASAHQNLRLVLVDQNVLRGEDAALTPRVVMVMDHHPKEGVWPPCVDLTVEPVGSCSSLVADWLLRNRPDRVTPALARCLRAAVLLDTVNLLPEARKAKPEDVAALERLEEAGGGDSAGRAGDFAALLSARRDLSAFASVDHLRRDFKAVVGVGGGGAGGPRVGLASLTTSAAEFLVRADAAVALAEFGADSGCSALLLLGSEKGDDGGYRRDLAVVGSGRDIVGRLVDFLAAHQAPSFDLRPAEAEASEAAAVAASVGGGRLLRQGNLAASRKQLLPAVVAFLAGDGSADATHTTTDQ